jgi:hypothetical protein
MDDPDSVETLTCVVLAFVLGLGKGGERVTHTHGQ